MQYQFFVRLSVYSLSDYYYSDAGCQYCWVVHNFENFGKNVATMKMSIIYGVMAKQETYHHYFKFLLLTWTETLTYERTLRILQRLARVIMTCPNWRLRG